MAQKIFEQLVFFGFDETTSKYILSDGALTFLDNAHLSVIGAIAKAKGKSLFLSPLSGGGIQGLHYFVHKQSGDSYYVIAQEGKVRYFNGTSWQDITDVSNVPTYFISSFSDWVFIFNGTDTPKKWSPTLGCYRIGIQRPTEAATFTSHVSGNLFQGREYSIKYTYYSSTLGIESSASPPSTYVTAGSQKGLRFTIPCSTDPQVNKIRVYRTLGNQRGIWYYEGEVNNSGTSVTFDCTTADILLSATPAPEDHDPPPNGKFLCFHMGRLFIAGDPNHPYRIYFSEPAPYHEYFPLDYFFHTPNGEAVTGMVSTIANLYIFTPNSISLLDTPTTSDPMAAWSIYQIDGNVGCIAPRSLVSHAGLMLFLSRYGIYAFDGRVLKPVPGLDPSRIDWSRADKACAAFYNNRYFICLPTGTNDYTLYELLLDNWKWVQHSTKKASVLISTPDGLIAGDPLEGKVWKFFSSDADNGSPFTVSFITPPLRIGNYPIIKEFSKLYLVMEGTGSVDVTIFVDKQESSATIPINGFGYYTFPQSTWRGREIQVKLSHTSDKPFIFYGLALVYQEVALP